MQKTVVTVVLLTKNPGSIFKQVMSSVLEQDFPSAYDILVVDSGSTDGTIEYVKSLPRVRLVEIPASEFGHGKTRNYAVSLCDSDFVAMLTHDATPSSTKWLANLVQPALEDPRIAGVFGRHFAYQEACIYTKLELDQHFDNLAHYPLVSKADDPHRYSNDEGWRQLLHFFSDNNALVRKEVWQSIPYPNVDFAEDQIWAKNIIEAGWKKAYADNAAVYHSHDYTLIDRFRRSFDESYALLRLFSYNLCPTLGHLFKNLYALVRRDLIQAKNHGYFKAHFYSVLNMPFDHFMRLFGHWLGAHGEKLPLFIKNRVSRDRRLLLGLNSTKARGDE